MVKCKVYKFTSSKNNVLTFVMIVGIDDSKRTKFAIKMISKATVSKIDE